MKKRPIAERFWEKVDRRGPDECWPWNGATAAFGHGCIYGDDRKLLAHRVSYELNVGPIPSGIWVLHRCDNPPCINPSHLFLGTPADNMADMAAKGRKTWVAGEVCWNAKLTPDDVIKIRESHLLQSEIAAQFGIAQSLVSKIRNRRAWVHVP